MHPGTIEIDIAGRIYSLVERTEGEHYESTLESDEDNVYTVRCDHGAWTCTCPDSKYRNRNNCKHVGELRRRLEEQERQPMSEPNATLARPVPAEVVPKPSSPPSALSSQSGRTQLCIALAKAQQAVGRLGHDARNEYHRYDYTSSEAIAYRS
jgi:hypothetical protein